MGHKIKTFIILFCFTFLSFCHTIYADTVTEAIKAVAKNDYITIKKMLDDGLDPNLKGQGSKQAGLLNTACSRGHIKIVQLLLSKGADVNLAGNQDRTPIMRAAGHAKTIDILKILIAKGADIQAIDEHGVSVLDNAVLGVVSRQTSMESLKFLVDQGLDVNKSTQKGKTAGYTALMVAARSNHIELAKYLISKGANVNAKAEQGDSPLSISMEEKYKEMTALFKKHGATAVSKEKAKQEKPEKASTDITKVMIILDASGSMWGQVEGKPKIQIAREVLKDLLPEFGTNIHLGLSAYGHRRKGDCEDIEILIPIGPNNANVIIKKIDTINPKGKTPLSEATRRAAKALKYTEERAIVLLISDGIETCNVDPCEVGAELAMNGIDFITHVISFDVKKEDQVGLKCLAENTGGLFLNAANARELRGALSKTVEKVKEAPEPIVEEPGDASLEAPDKAPAGSRVKVQWEGPNSRNDFITIVTKDAPEGTYQNYRYTSTGNPVSNRVPDKVGLYEIRYVFGRTKATLAKIDLNVTPVTATIEVASSVPVGSQFEIVWTGPDNEGDYIAIAQESADEKQYISYVYTSRGNPAKTQAPAIIGKYQLRYVMGKSNTVLARKDFSVSEVSAKIEAKESVLAGSDIQITWIGPNNKSDYITIVPKGTDEKTFFTYKYTSYGSPLKLKAPDTPGDYEIRYVLNQSKEVLVRTAIKVTKVSAQVDAPPTVKAGANFKVNWQGPNYQSDYITIVPAGSKDSVYLSYSYTSKGSPATLKAPVNPGKYEVRYILNQSRTTLARTSIIIN
jgi:Ca-activated chloride channel homolog